MIAEMQFGIFDVINDDHNLSTALSLSADSRAALCELRYVAV